MSLAHRHVGDDDVGGSADQRQISAQARPKSESPPQRRRRQAGVHQVLDDRNGGRRVRDVVDEGRDDRAHPEQRETGECQVTCRLVSEPVRDPADDADLNDCLDEHEQADEEEQRPPLDIAQGIVRIDAAHDHQGGCPEQGDRGRLEAERLMKQEARAGSARSRPGTNQQRPVGDGRRLGGRDGCFATLLRHLEMALEA